MTRKEINKILKQNCLITILFDKFNYNHATFSFNNTFSEDEIEEVDNVLLKLKAIKKLQTYKDQRPYKIFIFHSKIEENKNNLELIIEKGYFNKWYIELYYGRYYEKGNINDTLNYIINFLEEFVNNFKIKSVKSLNLHQL